MTRPDPEATRSRRLLLTVEPNPDPAHDYITTLAQSTGRNTTTEIHMVIRYVPDRDVLTADCLGRYLNVLAVTPPATPESMALAAIEDLNDVLIPRWAEVMAGLRSPGGTVHSVCVEDRQPGWDNPTLIARLAPPKLPA